MSVNRQFSLLLNNTTNSYKFLFLEAIIDRVFKDNKMIIAIDNLIIDMLVLAWYPNQYFKLSFGLQDQIGKVFTHQGFSYSSSKSISSATFNDELVKQIKNNIDRQTIKNSLAKYVQYRLLSPFFAEQLRGKKDNDKNNIIFALANEYFHITNPLYKISPCKNFIEINPLWDIYIHNNYTVIKGFLKVRWVEYLQVKNPSVPAIIHKTLPPAVRVSLNNQQKYWQSYLKQKPTSKCIYSHQRLTAINYSLDHFLPWSYVCHDMLWNLIPVCPNANSSKSNNLPSLSKYLPAFIEQQHDAVITTQKIFNKEKWQRLMLPYLESFKFSSYDELLNDNLFAKAFNKTYQNQYALAEQSGFAVNWQLSR